MFTVLDGLIVHNEAYSDSGDVARQLGLLPKSGSRAEARLATASPTSARRLRRAGAGGRPRRSPPGVWLVRGGRLRTMNVYLIEDEGGLTVFDAGIAAMAPALSVACARLGGAKRVVLGHADADHRGAAAVARCPGLLPRGGALGGELGGELPRLLASGPAVVLGAAGLPVAAALVGRGCGADRGDRRRGR